MNKGLPFKTFGANFSQAAGTAAFPGALPAEAGNGASMFSFGDFMGQNVDMLWYVCIYIRYIYTYIYLMEHIASNMK